MADEMKEKIAVKEAFTELAPRYETVLDNELRIFWGWSYQAFVDQLIVRTDISENQKVLDIATGTAVIPRKISQKKIPGTQIFGLDITESMLLQGKKRLPGTLYPGMISLTCADAMSLPFADNTFDIIITGLASHHINISSMFIEIYRTLKKNGKLSMIDVGITPFWHFPIVRGISKVIAFVYFLINENLARAYAEAAAVSNVNTAEEWNDILVDLGFSEIIIEELPVPRKWLPSPLSVRATRS